MMLFLGIAGLVASGAFVKHQLLRPIRHAWSNNDVPLYDHEQAEKPSPQDVEFWSMVLDPATRLRDVSA